MVIYDIKKKSFLQNTAKYSASAIFNSISREYYDRPNRTMELLRSNKQNIENTRTHSLIAQL